MLPLYVIGYKAHDVTTWGVWVCGYVRISEGCGYVRISEGCGYVRISEGCGYVRISEGCGM